MSLRQTPRQSERELRIHDTRPSSAHPHIHPHVNGNVQPLNSSAIVPQSRTHPSPTVSTNGAPVPSTNVQKLSQANEQTWLLIGRVAEQMNDWDHALSAYENALRHNSNSLTGLIAAAGIARIKEDYKKAVEYFQRVVELQQDNGDVWSSLGHCYLMLDDLQKAYSAYQQALYLLPAPKDDPKLWYGIGILYDRYGSLDHAEEAFASVLKMNKDFDKSNEILFRLGIIYKQRSKYAESLQCFEQILRNPPIPLAHADIWFQIGHVYEQQGDLARAKMAYEKVVQDNPNHAKVLQQLGWLHHQDGSTFQNQETAVTYLTRSLEADPHDAQSWYLLGRAYMAGQKYNKAYEAYQQAVYRDGRNPTFWCSIGVLYFQINQYRDALDAYSRAIRINPYISEVWFDLGSLYESCNNQISDAIDAYARAAELDPRNTVITQRLELLKQAQATGAQLPAAPGPQDVHPTAYANTVVQPPGLTGPPLLLQPGSAGRMQPRGDTRNGDSGLPLPPPPSAQVGPGRSNSPRPFRGGPPPPVILDDSRHSQSRPQLAPMEVDRPPHHRDQPSLYSSTRGPSRGLAGHPNILLHQPVPQPPSEARNGLTHSQSHPHDQHFTSSRPIRAPSTSASPAPRNISPRGSSFPAYLPSTRGPTGPGHPPRSPRAYAPELSQDREFLDRRGPPNDHRDWERERRGRHVTDYPPAPPPQMFARTHSPAPSYRGHSPRPARDYSPPAPSPRNTHQGNQRPYPHPPWGDAKSGAPPVSRSPPLAEVHSRRYDPRMDGREYEAVEIRPELRSRPPSLQGSPESIRSGRHAAHPPPHNFSGPGARTSPSPRLVQQPPITDQRGSRRRGGREKEVAEPVFQGEPPKRERKKRTASKRKDEVSQEMYASERSNSQQAPFFRVAFANQKTTSSPEPVSSNGSASASRSVQPSPTSATPLPPSREVDEDYDEGVAEVLVGLASYRPGAGPAQSASGGRASPRPPRQVAGSIRDRPSPALSTSSSNQKRPLSPSSEENLDMKRSRVDVSKRRVSSPSTAGSKATPVPSTRPSPIPFRTQPPSSPEARQTMETSHPYRPPTPPLPTVLPPHPRPIGSGMALPPIMTMSTSSGSSPPGPDEDRMQVDGSHRSRSISPPPPSRAKISEVMNRPTKSPTPPSM